MPKKKMTIEQLARLTAKGFEGTTSKFEGVASKKDIARLEKKMAEIEREMITKSFLEDKLADLEGSVVIRQRKEDRKVDLLIEFLKRKKLLGKTEVNMLKEIQVFPSFSKS